MFLVPGVENLSVAVSGNSAIVSFSQLNGLVSEKVEVKTLENGKLTNFSGTISNATLSDNTVTYSVFGLQPSVSYNFEVTIIVNNQGQSRNATNSISKKTLGLQFLIYMKIFKLSLQ